MNQRVAWVLAAVLCTAEFASVSGQPLRNLTIRVFREGTWSGGTGQMVDGANVCVGTAPFKVTPSNGTVTFQVPERQTVEIITFKSGFIGNKRSHLMGTYDSTVNIGLQIGSGGYNCPGSTSSGSAAPVISNFRIKDGVASTTNPEVALNFNWSGIPVQMRHALSESGLNAAPWRGFQKDPLVAIGGHGPTTYTVYFQVRDSANRTSTTVSDSILLTRSDGSSGGPPTQPPPPPPTDAFAWTSPTITQAEATRHSLPAGAVNHNVSEIVHGQVIVRSDNQVCTACHRANSQGQPITSPILTQMSRTDFCTHVPTFVATSTKPQNLKDFFQSGWNRNCPCQRNNPDCAGLRPGRRQEGWKCWRGTLVIRASSGMREERAPSSRPRHRGIVVQSAGNLHRVALGLTRPNSRCQPIEELVRRTGRKSDAFQLFIEIGLSLLSRFPVGISRPRSEGMVLMYGLWTLLVR